MKASPDYSASSINVPPTQRRTESAARAMDDLRDHRGQRRGVRAVQHPAGGHARSALWIPGWPEYMAGDPRRRCRRTCPSPKRLARSPPTTCSCSSTGSGRRRREAPRPADLDVPARRVHAPVRQHALPVDLRRQRRVPAGPRALPARRTSCTGAAATLVLHAAVAPMSTLPLVGASGAISGVLGFYFLWFPRNVVRVLVFLFPLLMRVFEIPARIVLGDLPRAGQPAAADLHGRAERRRRRARRAHRRVPRRPGGGVGDRSRGPPVPRRPSTPRRRPRRQPPQCRARRRSIAATSRQRRGPYFSAVEPDPLPPSSTLALADWLASTATSTPRSSSTAGSSAIMAGIRRPPRRNSAPGLVELRRGQLAAAYQHLRAVPRSRSCPAHPGSRHRGARRDCRAAKVSDAALLGTDDLRVG